MPVKKSTLIYRTDLVNVGIGQGQKEIVPYLYSETNYDPEGRVLRQCTTNAAGLVTEKVEFEYDPLGRLVHETYYTDDVDPSEEKSFEYDQEGRIMKEKVHYLDGSFDTIEYHYNDEGLLTEKTTVNDEGESEGKEIYTYKKGKPETHEITDGENNLLLSETFGYDDQGNLILHIRNDEESGEYVKMKAYFGDQGNKVREELYDIEENLVEATAFETDGQGRVIRTVEESGRNRRIKHFSYDDKGNGLGYEETSGSGDKLVVVEHHFDQENNPLSSLVFINGSGRSMSQHYELKYEYQWFE